ncbi:MULTISPECIES: hypothetical protein [Rhodococcus]|uniref:hypothetical protein n=1 Tax=Rhodococcus TaxID=1827 RepID=UPI000871ED2A|nr:hypothetical protein [Rhodococcus sp. 1139]OFE08359.1 hypothetical protein A5N83_12910 [Rhodococcus sp. 1139]
MDQATDFHPTNRPTAVEFRDELTEWLERYPGHHPRPKFTANLPQGFTGLRRVLAQIQENQRMFLDATRKECREILGAIDWDESVSVAYDARKVKDSDENPRHLPIMAAHGRSEDDEWDDALVLALQHPAGLRRLVVGGFISYKARVDLLIEYQERVNGAWELKSAMDVPDLPIARLTTGKRIRSGIAEALEAATDPTSATVVAEGPARSWAGSRIL